jgi:hypothetical protein
MLDCGPVRRTSANERLRREVTALGVLSAIVIDCHRAADLARFWAGVIDGYPTREYDEAEIARLAALGLTPATDPTVAVDGPGPTLVLPGGPREEDLEESPSSRH